VINEESLASRVRAYVAAMPPAISGQSGHDATFAVAKKLVHDFGMSEHDAWPILLDYNSRCQPPWSERELRHKLENAGKLTRAAKSRGHLRQQSTKTMPPLGSVVSWTKTPASLPKKPDAFVADMVKHSDQQDAEPRLVNLGNQRPPSPSSSSPIATQRASIPAMITDPREADLRNRGFSQERINGMTLTEAWEILRPASPETAPRGPMSDVSSPAQSNPESTALEPGTPQFEIEARRIADELERLHRDGAIANKSVQDPDASFYANLLHGFDATYIGKVSSAPASAVR
jgi:hypothetical protein